MPRIYVAVRLGVALGALALLGWAPAAAQEQPVFGVSFRVAGRGP